MVASYAIPPDPEYCNECMQRLALRIVWICLLLGGGNYALAQATEVPDTLLQLEPITVSAAPLTVDRLSAAQRSWPREALRTLGAQHLGELLSGHSGVFIKNYGPGSLATAAVRGGAAGHTAVLWNGLPVQSPMLGQLDLSLIPLPLLDAVTLQYGGGSAVWGSGAIAGSLLLDNAPPDTTGWRIGSRPAIGSFRRRESGAELSFGTPRWQTRTRFSRLTATNDFPYRLRADLPPRHQTNARLQQQHVLQEVYWRSGSRIDWALRAWWQETDRGIPPTTVQTRSLANQQDEALRLSLHGNYRGERLIWQVRGGHFRERLRYQDPLILLDAPSSFTTSTAALEVSNQPATWRWLAGLSGQRVTAVTSSYAAGGRQLTTAAYGTLRYAAGHWRGEFSLRGEIIDGRPYAPFPALRLAWLPLPGLQVNAGYSRDFRFPTLNDRFWQPGGNPDLRPERGGSTELGLSYTDRHSDRTWRLRSTVYDRRIENWILWAPRAGESYFAPQNLTKVRSRGWEQRLGYTRHGSRITLRIDLGYDWTRSTNEVAIKTPRLGAGEQLIYVPRHQAFGVITGQWRGWELDYRHQYTGTVRGQNEASLPDYALGALTLAFALPGERLHWRSFLRIDNLWNTDYRVIERRPMPGRSFTLGVNCDFSHRASSRINSTNP